ncbi:hypothetical protein [Salinisphaera sp.]|uniref:hypothetical protein n=1 Tax=Salinisphaera sp. TaxID=1914330 RepID=UPI002D791699|nr:hypothetical protein [Salinisphaera sp.]HET7315584.1 hypothetical protein [Salinisphaera sp.]
MKQIRHEESPGESIRPLEPARRAKLEATVPPLSGAYRRKQRRRYRRWRLKNLISRRLVPARHGSTAAFHSEFAIAIIGVGPRYRAWARTLIHGLRGPGRYAGPVYVITDDPRQFADFDNTSCIRIAPTRHQMVIKTCKTFLHQWLAERYVLYLDADILVGCDIRAWCEQALECLAGHAALFYPDPSSRRMPYHGGLMLIDSDKAGPFFKAWRRCLASGHFRQDQEALLACAESFDLGRPPAYGLSFPAPENVRAGERDCFIHLTSYRYSQLGHDACYAYLCNTLGLRPSQAAERLDLS